MLNKIKNIFLDLKSYIDGDFAYKKYLEHHKEHHFNQAALDKKTFLNNRQKEKFSKINRCC